MALKITSLNTGSNGNCFYVGNDDEAVLIDVGLSCKETELRMARLGLSMQAVKAIFITHEHSDHIRGLPVIAKKYSLPIYITHKTMLGGRLNLNLGYIRPFNTTEPIAIGNLFVKAFSKKHDAAEPHSFVVSCNGVSVGVFTDIGSHCENLITHFKQCHAVFLEANYDEDMLRNGRYPYFLKNRIAGGNGHLSNRQALELFINHRSAQLSHLFLSHLSKDNNDPDLVYQLFNQHANGCEIVVASRHCETPVYHISA